MRRVSHQKLEKLFDMSQGIVQRQDVVDAGIHPRELSAWVQSGKIERLQPGVYRLVESPPLPYEGILELSLRVPKAVVCLASALDFHEIGTVSPARVQLAMPRGAYHPTIDYPPVDFFSFSLAVYGYGIENHSIANRNIQVYSPEKTLADSLFYRHRFGKAVFLEALTAYLQQKRANIPKLVEAAKVRRVDNVMQPYLEALA